MPLDSAKWIWATDSARPDEYAEFLEQFDFTGKEAHLYISADSGYAVYLNGALCAFGQYADFPYDKVYDALLLADKEKYTSYVLSTIEKTYTPMIELGGGTVWETELGERDFANAGSLCHGWSAIPVYCYHTLLGKQLKGECKL